jgi:DegV family protein with EDD domain
MPVRIVTDSSCDLTDEEVAAHGIEVVPLSIRFGDEELEDRTELSVEAFYDKLAASAVLPETAAPAPGKFEAAFRRQAAAGADAVVCINLSSDLSATMQSAQNAAKAVADDLDVRVVDSHSITSGLGTQVLLAAEAAAGGATADEVVALVEDLAARTHVVGALDTLDNLKKGGRIGGAQALLGSLLSIKPIVDISTGKVEEAGKARTRKKALEVLRDKVAAAGAVEHLCVTHGLAPEVDDVLELLAPLYARDQIRVGLIGPVIGTHGGPRVMGVTWVAPA